jgi:hypothetical protein
MTHVTALDFADGHHLRDVLVHVKIVCGLADEVQSAEPRMPLSSRTLLSSSAPWVSSSSTAPGMMLEPELRPYANVVAQVPVMPRGRW